MNKTLGLILSILFIFEIFLFGIPLVTTQAASLPPVGQGYAYYLSQNSSVVFIYNVSGITLSNTNASNLQNAFATSFNVLLNFNGTTYTLPISSYAGDVYFAYNPSTNKIEYVIIVANVIGQSSASTGLTVPVSSIYQLGIPSNLVISNNTQSYTPVSSLVSIPVITNAPSQVRTDIENPSTTAPYFFYEYITGQLTTSISVGSVTISSGTTNTVLVFAPFEFVSPSFIPSPAATGFFNPLQINGALGPAMKSAASTKPYIWGRALINTSIIDPFVYSGYDNLTFQLNYSAPGPLQINMAQLGYIASITNYPSSFTYLSYKFANGYVSFLGFIADYNSTSGKTTLQINGVQAPISGLITIVGPNGKSYTYALTLIALTSQSGVVEYFSNLMVYYYNVSGNTLKLVNTTAYYNDGQILPVYGYSGPLTITGTFGGKQATVTITVGSSPTLTLYVASTSLVATAYEGIEASVNGYYTTSPILSTPPSSLAIKGTTVFQDAGNLYSTYARATLTLLTNATLTFNNINLPGFSFAGIIVTPAYPIINGTSAMQYMATAQYTTINGEYELLISGSQIAMQTSTYNRLLDLQEVADLGRFADTILSPNVPGAETGQGQLTLEFITPPQYAYLTLVDFKIWTNNTVVSVQAYSGSGKMVTVNKGYFYAVIIPPRISTSKITPQSFECYNAPYVYIYDPDAILVPGNPTGSFTYTPGLLYYNGKNETGAIIFYGSTVYNATGGVFAYPTSYLKVSSVGSVSYVTTTNNVGLQVTQLSSSVSPSLLQYYADNNPTVNFYFEQSNYMAGLTVSYGNITLSSENTPGYIKIIPQNIPYNADYVITNYVTFKVLTSYAPDLVPYKTNAFVTITPNASFVGATDYYNYMSTDYAVYFNLKASKQYQVQTQITVPNVTAALYFASNVTPLYALNVPLYYSEPYYGANLPAYLALGTYGPLYWNAPNFLEFGAYATPLYLAKMLSVNVTLPSGTKYTILLTTKNITTLFVSLDAQQLQYCNGTYEFEISIPGLESILHLNAQQLNGSILTVSVYDYVTHETLVASTKLAALSGLALVTPPEPGEVFYFLTFKASTTLLTASTPWFIATSMYKEPFLSLSDKEYANTNPTSILSLTITNITVFHNGYKAVVYYNPSSGRTIAINVYGQVVLNASGNLLPTIPETAAGSGIFNATLPFVIIQNNTVTTMTVSNITLYVNGTLGLQLANGQVVALGPAADFVLPFVTYQGVQIGYDANVSVTVSDPISSLTVSTYLMPANITPIRLAPIPTIPPMPHAPVGNYYYSKPVVVTPTNPVINIYATSVLPYPYEFFIVAIVRPGANASTAAPVVYYSYQAVVAKPALGSTLQPYIEVAVQMSGILSLPPGTYTVQMYAVPFAQGPVISEYPVSLIFTNVTIQ